MIAYDTDVLVDHPRVQANAAVAGGTDWRPGLAIGPRVGYPEEA